MDGVDENCKETIQKMKRTRRPQSIPRKAR